MLGARQGHTAGVGGGLQPPPEHSLQQGGGSGLSHQKAESLQVLQQIVSSAAK